MTAPQDIRGLTERLRELKAGPFTVSARDDDDPPQRLPINPDGPEAAAALESLDTLVGELVEALTPSAETKAAYMGEFSFQIPDGYELGSGDELCRSVDVPWTTIKEIMTAIHARAKARANRFTMGDAK